MQSKEARRAQAKLRVASSDALSALNALLGFLAARNQSQYCRQAFLAPAVCPLLLYT